MALLNAIQLLNELERMEQIRKCGGDQRKIEMFGMCYKKHTDLTANGLTAAVIRWIELHGGQAERINTQGTYIKGKTVGVGMYGVKHLQGKFIPSGSTRGSADISAIIKTNQGTAISLKIEVKIGRDKQSKYQKEYQKNIEAAGGIYIICKSFENFIEQYDRIISF